MRSYESFHRLSGSTQSEVDAIEPFARMSTKDEFLAQLTKVSPSQKDVPPGIVLYKEVDGTAYVRTECIHTLVSGATGSGKSLTMNANTLQYWARTGNPIVVMDPKSQLLSLSADGFLKQGYDLKVIYLKDPTRGIRYNPLSEITKKLLSKDEDTRTEGRNELSDLYHGLIVADTPASEKYWSNNPWTFMTGLTAELIERLGDAGEVTIPMMKMAAAKIVIDREKMAQFELTLSSNNPNAPDMVNMLSMMADVTRAGMNGYLFDGLSIVRSPAMQDLASGNQIDFHEMASGRPIALFIVTPDNSSIYDVFVSTILDQALKTFYSDADNLYAGTLPKEILFLLEEFSNVPQIPSFTKEITTARSRGIHFMLSVQSLSQLYARYGTSADTISDNCLDWICTSGDPWFAEKLSNKIGYNVLGREVITKNTLRCLPPGRPLVVLNKRNPFISSIRKAEVPKGSYLPARRERVNPCPIDLDALIFHPDKFCSTRHSATNDTDDLDQQFSALFGDVNVNPNPGIADRVKEFDGNIESPLQSDRDDVLIGTVIYCIQKEWYRGQRIRVRSLIEFANLLSESHSLYALLDLVALIVNVGDVEASYSLFSESCSLKISVSKEQFVSVIKSLYTEFSFFKL